MVVTEADRIYITKTNNLSWLSKDTSSSLCAILHSLDICLYTDLGPQYSRTILLIIFPHATTTGHPVSFLCLPLSLLTLSYLYVLLCIFSYYLNKRMTLISFLQLHMMFYFLQLSLSNQCQFLCLSKISATFIQESTSPLISGIKASS